MKTWLNQASRSGQEAGGILLGSIEQDSSGQKIVTIEDCAAIRIPHRHGPQFTLAPQDAKPLESAVVRWRSQKDVNVAPVGFTRSHLRPGLYLDPADFALFWNYFPDPGSVFLLVRPEPEALAGFFFWERGELHRQDSYLSFPFDPERLARDAAHTVLRGPSLAMNAAPKSELREPKRLPAPAAPPGRVKFSVQPGDGQRLGWIGAALVILLLSAILWQPSKTPRSAGSPRSSELGLNIDHLGPALRLTWNPHASVVEGATRGVLWVLDGASRKKIDLDGRQLAHGSVMYVPDSDQVEFRLEVEGSGQPVANSILSLTPAAQPELAEVVPLVPEVPPEPVERSRTPVKPAAPSTEERGTSLAASAAPSPAPPASEKPAAIAKEQPAAVTTPKAEPTPSSFARQALPSISLSYEYAPLPERAHRKGIDKIPVIRLFHHHPKPAPASADSETVVPAKPLQAFKPHVPSDLARALPGEWRVDVKAIIDEKGRVLQLEPLSSTMDPRLVRLAMNAVNDWDFEAANIGGHAAKSGLVVTFRFHIPPDGESERSANRH